MTKTQLIKTLQSNYAALETALAGLSSITIANTPIHNQWTIKDILAHLAHWENLEANWISTVTAGQRPQLYEPDYQWDESDFKIRAAAIDKSNAHYLIQNKSIPLDRVLTNFRQTQQNMLTACHQLPSQALTDPSILFWIAVEVPRKPWLPIPVNSHEHYHDHTQWINDWRNKQ